jgi:preprotein translocase subunit Sec63
MLNKILFKTNPTSLNKTLNIFGFNKMNSKFFNDKINRPRKDYYQILGVPKNATEEEIKIAYRSLAKRYHPDVNITGTETHEPDINKFRDIADAYAVLSNKTMRMDYDLKIRNFPNSDYSVEK